MSPAIIAWPCGRERSLPMMESKMSHSMQCGIKGMGVAIVLAALFGAIVAYDLMHGYIGSPM
jgi:hypothetical protein